MKKITKKQLDNFENLIKEWVCPKCYKKGGSIEDESMVKCYKKDRKDLRVVLNNLRKGRFKRAHDKLYWLDTVIREICPRDVYDFLLDWEERYRG